MKSNKSLLIAAGMLLSLTAAPRAFADVVACDPADSFKTCWKYDSVDSVVVRSMYLFPGYFLSISGKVGSATRTTTLVVPLAKDALYNNVLDGCQKLALLAQASPEKVKLQIDSDSTPVSPGNELIIANISSTSISCQSIAK